VLVVLIELLTKAVDTVRAPAPAAGRDDTAA